MVKLCSYLEQGRETLEVKACIFGQTEKSMLETSRTVN